MPKAVDWNAQKIEQLTKFWNAGLSASQVAIEIGTTRNSIIGKVHRLGLARWIKPKSEEERNAAIAETRRKRAEQQRIKRSLLEKKPDTRRRKKMQQEPKIGPVFEGFIGILFADLRPYSKHVANECRYIPAEPPGPQYLACGNATAPGESYCEHCKDITFFRPYKITDQDRARRVFGMRKAAIPRTVAGDDIVEDAA
jgi:GcrA cell cycle regulator